MIGPVTDICPRAESRGLFRFGMAAFTERSSTGCFGRTLFTYSRPLGTRHFTLITDGCALHG